MEAEVRVREIPDDAALLALETEEGATNPGMQVTLEAEKDKERGSSQEPPEGTPLCEHIDFRTSDLNSKTMS